MTCARCRTVSRSRAKFCAECGARFSRDARAPAEIAAVSLDHVEPVLGAIARPAARLRDAKGALVFRVEGDHYRLVAQHGVVRAIATPLDPRPINRRSAAGCAILDKRTIHVRDLAVAARTRSPESAPQLLLVEDNEMNRDMLSRRLQRRGYEVLTAVDGESGLALTKSETPALVLMDMSLPGIDGWEVTRQLKADPATRTIPVIALTAHAMAGDREQALATGCDDFDIKPIDLDRLLGKIETLLGGKAKT